MIFPRFLLAASCSVIALASATSLGQGAHSIGNSRIEVGSWVFQAAYAPDAGGGATTIDSIFAFAKPGTVIDDNLVAVWYQRQQGNSWASKSWVTTDQSEVVESIKQELSISDAEDSKWATSGASFAGVAQSAQGYAAGLLVADPLSALIEDSPDRELILTILADAGYKAASVPSDQAGACGTDDQLDGMSNEFALMINLGDSTTWSASAIGAMCGVVAKEWKTTVPPGYTPRTPCPGCSPAPWTPPGTPWFPEITFPVTPNRNLPGWQQNPVCVTIGSGCRCSSYGHATNPTPGTPLMPMRITCPTAGVCPDPSPASLAPGPSCTTEYYY